MKTAEYAKHGENGVSVPKSTQAVQKSFLEMLMLSDRRSLRVSRLWEEQHQQFMGSLVADIGMSYEEQGGLI